MSAFRFTAIPLEGGRLVRGKLDADSARQVRSLLREQGLLACEVVAETSTVSERAVLRLANSRLTSFFRQLSALLDAGLTVDESLMVLSEQSDHDREKQLIGLLRSDIASGLSLSAAMLKLPRAFPSFYAILVRAGETAGRLPKVMQRLSVYLEERAELVSSVILAFIYPAVVFCVSVLVVVGMLTWVVPQMVQVFQGARQSLPFITRLLLSGSAVVREWGGGLLLALLVGAVALMLGLRNDAFCLRFHRWRLGLPLFGRFERSSNTARFASTLAILVGSGVPLLSSLSAGEGVITNRVQRAAASEAARQVREGASLSRALAASREFPPILVHLIASGEATGRLDLMLERVAQELSRDLSRRAKAFTSLLGPAVVLLMGGVVLFIVLAILLPVFEINQFVK